jgi:predicted ATPase with chaperone activity
MTAATITNTNNNAPYAREPLHMADLGVDAAIVRDIGLKTMFYQGRFTRAGLADALKVSVTVVEELLQTLVRDGLATVLSSENLNTSAHVYALTQIGSQRAEETLSRNNYVGPVPVSLAAYVQQVNDQSVAGLGIEQSRLAPGLDALVLPEETRRRVGWAVSSHRPLMIHGASGNGKTTLARNIANAIGGTIRVPYAIEVVGQIVRVFDSSKHKLADKAVASRPADRPEPDDLLQARTDRRWVEIERPVIWAGGELTRSSLELVYDSEMRIYESPLQLKANGGVLIIDDLGRQQIPAIQLLNRWIVALEAGVDHLTLHTGQMVEVPFDLLLIFSTNLPPEDLADEAFLRRIRYKVKVENPTETEYRAIFRRECDARGITYSNDVLERLLSAWYSSGREMRGCHPRDLVEAAVDATRSTGSGGSLVLTSAIVDEACASYFL